MFLSAVKDAGGFDDVLTIFAPNKPPAQKPNAENGWISTAGGVLQLINQQRLANENLERARQGLEPISYNDIPGMVPTMQFGVEENTRNSGLMLVALGVGAFLLFNMAGNKSSRAYEGE